MNTRADPAISATSRFGVDPPCVAEGPTPSGYYPPMGSPTSDATGNVSYGCAGVGHPIVPTPGLVGAWNFPQYGLADGTVPAGFVDGASTGVGNEERCLVVGPGTMTAYVRQVPTGTPGSFIVNAGLYHVEGAPGFEVLICDEWRAAIDCSSGGPGADIVFVVPNDGYCYHWVEISPDSPGRGAIFGVGFGGFTWVSGAAGSGKQFLRGHVTFSNVF
jgi:hypothetical protein